MEDFISDKFLVRIMACRSARRRVEQAQPTIWHRLIGMPISLQRAVEIFPIADIRTGTRLVMRSLITSGVITPENGLAFSTYVAQTSKWVVEDPELVLERLQELVVKLECKGVDLTNLKTWRAK